MSKQLQTLRTKIAALQQERAVLLGQERSRAEVEAYVHEWATEQHAEFEARARLALRGVATGDAGAALAGVYRGAGLQYGATTVSVPLVGIVGPDAIAEALLRHIAAVPEGKDAAARADRLQAIAAELDSLEAREEAAITASEATASPLTRRSDARPEIVLALPA